MRFDESDFAEVSKAATSRRNLLVSHIQCKWMGMTTIQMSNASNDEVWMRWWLIVAGAWMKYEHV
jgi:hypothetical protein